MYCRLKARIEIGNRITSVVVPVKKGVRQGSLLSSSLYDNSVLNAQACVNVLCISKNINVSLLTYADDLLNLSRSIRGLQSNFSILRDEYRKIGLAFNTSKSAVLFFNDSPSQPEHLLLGS